jgi:hypothetical protein
MKTITPPFHHQKSLTKMLHRVALQASGCVGATRNRNPGPNCLRMGVGPMAVTLSPAIVCSPAFRRNMQGETSRSPPEGRTKNSMSLPLSFGRPGERLKGRCQRLLRAEKAVRYTPNRIAVLYTSAAGHRNCDRTANVTSGSSGGGSFLPPFPIRW